MVSSYHASVHPNVASNEYILIVNIACLSPVTQNLLIGILKIVQECRLTMVIVREHI